MSAVNFPMGMASKRMASDVFGKRAENADVIAFRAILESFGSRGDDRPEASPAPVALPNSAVSDAIAANAELLAENGRLHAEIARLLSAQRSAARDIFEARALLTEAETQKNKIRATISFRLGKAMIEAGQSWRGTIRFPQIALALAHEARQRRYAALRAPAREIAPKPARQLQIIERALAIFRERGIPEATAWAKARRLEKPMLGRVLVDIASTARSSDPKMAAALAVEAIELDPAQYRVTHLAFTMADDGRLAEAATIIEAAKRAGVIWSATERRKIDRLLGRAAELCVIPRQKRLEERRQSSARRQLAFLSGGIAYLARFGRQLSLHASAAGGQRVGKVHAYVSNAPSPSDSLPNPSPLRKAG